MKLHNLSVVAAWTMATGAATAAFLPQGQRSTTFHRNLQHHHTQQSTKLHSAMDKGEYYDFFNDEYDDQEDYIRYNFSQAEKKKLAKSFFAEVLEYDEEQMKPEEVHIILFNPNTNREGVHTIEFPKNSGNNIILAFESKDECEQFSMNLKEQHFFDPVPQEMNLDSLEEYCQNIGVDIQVVPEGTALKPPTKNSLNLGLNPNLEKEMAMLENLFHMSDSDSGEFEEDNIDEAEDHTFPSSSSAAIEDSTGAWE